MENCNLTFSEKAIIEDNIAKRLEDRIDYDLQQKLEKIHYILKAGADVQFNYSQRIVIIQQLELLLETKLEPDYEEKIKKIIKKLEDF